MIETSERSRIEERSRREPEEHGGTKPRTIDEEAALMDGTAQLSYWLIARYKSGRSDVLAFGLSGGEEVLPIFSHREEAARFLRLGMWMTGWRARETSTEELTSVLLGPCAAIGRVLVDPWPEIDAKMMAALVGIRRKDFVGLIMGKGKPLAPAVKRKASRHTSRPGFCHPAKAVQGLVDEERVNL